MRSLLSFVVVLAAMLAGCSSVPGPNTEGDADAAAPETGPSSFELLNTSVAWPRHPAETAHEHPFEMPANVTNATLFYNRYALYPAGYQLEVNAWLEAPDGTATTLEHHTPISTTPYVCTRPVCAYPEDREFVLEPQAGTWTIHLDGFFTATATLRVVAQGQGATP